MNSTDNEIGVFSQSKKVNQSIALLNWVRSSQENYDLFTYGVEGTNYKAVGTGKIDTSSIATDKLYKVKTWMWTDFSFERLNNFVSDAYAQSVKSWDKGARSSPLLGFVFDTTNVQEQLNAMDTAYSQYGDYITRGVYSYSDKYSAFESALKSAGYDKVKTELQKQINAYKASKK
jgi:putative aldouronate transport system substrate-binding protein